MSLLELGYEVNRTPTRDEDSVGHRQIKTLPKGIALPMSDSLRGPYVARNSLWNGLCRDPIAEEVHNPTEEDED